MTNNTIQTLRNTIDTIDEEIIKLLAERMKVVKKIGEKNRLERH